MATAAERNRSFYDDFWGECTDFSKYNPGARHRRRVLARIIRALDYRTVLDVGCGDGETLLWLRTRAPAGVVLAGADLSPATVERNVDRHAFARFFVLDIERDTLAETFDLVLCSEVIEHLDARTTAVANLARLVSPGGHLVITCPTGKVHATERHFGHVAHPSEGGLREMIERAGLEVVSLENWGFPFYGALKYLTNVRPEWALKNFGTTTYTTTSKIICGALYAANFLNMRSSRHGCALFAVARRGAG